MTDGDSTQESSLDYPWYRQVAGDLLEQGDLFFEFPFVSIVSSYDDILQQRDVDFERVYYNIIVLSQSCDLVAKKIEHVLACPFFPKDQLAAKFDGLAKPNGEQLVQRGRWESLYLLPPCQVGDLDLPPRIVNFRQVLAIPYAHIAKHAMQQESRVRLCPPYREHLAQAFARFIMRIGFPIDFRP